MTLSGLIEGYAREYRVTQREMAFTLGMCERTFRRKIKTPEALTVGQIRTLKALLHIPADEMGETICGS